LSAIDSKKKMAMLATISHKGRTFKVDFLQPIDISIPLRASEECVSAWYVSPMKLEPVKSGSWVGDVNQGGSVNFRNISFNPHGNGTHTECVGHISREFCTINENLRRFVFTAELITVIPIKMENGDHVITKSDLEKALQNKVAPEALIIRTPNGGPDKLNRQYSHTNPPYIAAEAIDYLNSLSIEHLLIDLPSIDKESDEGKLAAHHAFWKYPHSTELHKTITELILVPDEVEDGSYLLNLQIAPFENDASPSKPVLYKMQ
jgi:arylformamidase